MPSSTKSFTVTEFGGFCRGGQHPKFTTLPTHAFDALEAFVLSQEGEDANEGMHFFSLASKRGVGKVIIARNYVGVITLTDGTVIEVLPKIAGVGVTQGEARDLFLEMLRTVDHVAFKSSNRSHLSAGNVTLFEIFIEMFLLEVARVVQQGLKSSYVPVQSNEGYFKGRLLVAQNFKQNLVRRDRFYVEQDVLSPNRPENRLLKSTLLLLQAKTRVGRNKTLANRLLAHFNDVPNSVNHTLDFRDCNVTRGMKHYQRALGWSRIFLKGSSFTVFAGAEVAVAILFPMEMIFESYVAAKLRALAPKQVSVKTQDRTHSLFSLPRPMFALRPDIVLQSTLQTTVVDTKWKMLTRGSRTFGISQGDMYQMYAYAKKYDAKQVVLLYPKTDEIAGEIPPLVSDDGVTVMVQFVDLRDPERSLRGVCTGPIQA